ncbi:MAG: ribonuclease III [Methylococcales bacterium]
MNSRLDELCHKLRLDFRNKDLLKNALTHRSMGADNNERLEFLGDSVLGYVIAEALFHRYPEADEGVLSRFRAGLVNGETLASRAREIGLGDYLILGSGELKSGGFQRASILSDALEAIIGAISKDQGFEASRQWILELFADQLEGLSSKQGLKDPKTVLQELMQAKKLNIPKYILKSQKGLPHEQHFTVECIIQLLKEPTIGKGGSRKKAEQQAAEKALANLPTRKSVNK